MYLCLSNDAQSNRRPRGGRGGGRGGYRGKREFDRRSGNDQTSRRGHDKKEGAGKIMMTFLLIIEALIIASAKRNGA